MAKTQIQLLTEAVEKLINHPVAPVLPVAPVAPVLPILPSNSGDHDVLNTLVGSVANLDKNFTEKFQEVRNDIQKLSDGTSKQISDHEVRIGKLETAKTTQNVMMSIGIGILTLLTSLLTYHLFK